MLKGVLCCMSFQQRRRRRRLRRVFSKLPFIYDSNEKYGCHGSNWMIHFDVCYLLQSHSAFTSVWLISILSSILWSFKCCAHKTAKQERELPWQPKSRRHSRWKHLWLSLSSIWCHKLINYHPFINWFSRCFSLSQSSLFQANKINYDFTHRARKRARD